MTGERPSWVPGTSWIPADMQPPDALFDQPEEVTDRNGFDRGWASFFINEIPYGEKRPLPADQQSPRGRAAVNRAARQAGERVTVRNWRGQLWARRLRPPEQWGVPSYARARDV